LLDVSAFRTTNKNEEKLEDQLDTKLNAKIFHRKLTRRLLGWLLDGRSFAWRGSERGMRFEARVQARD